jgi:Flp pilus assembly protein TadG
MNPRNAGMMFGRVLEAVPRIPTAWKNAGSAAVEFAIFVPFFAIIVAGTFDLGYLIYTASELTAAVSAASQYAENNAAMVSSNPSGLAADISTVISNANGPNWAIPAVNVNNGSSTNCYCPTGSPANWTWGTAMTCGKPCTGGGGVAGKFVTISGSHNVSPLFPTFGLTYNGTISRTAMVETQ